MNQHTDILAALCNLLTFVHSAFFLLLLEGLHVPGAKLVSSPIVPLYLITLPVTIGKRFCKGSLAQHLQGKGEEQTDQSAHGNWKASFTNYTSYRRLSK